MRVPAHDPLDGCWRVETCCYCAAEGFYARDCGFRGPRYYDVYFGGEGFGVLGIMLAVSGELVG